MATEKFFVFNEDGALKRLKGRIVRFLDNEDPSGADKDAIRTSLEVSPDAEGLVQADVGTAPNEIPVNGMLGDMAFQSSDGVSVASLEITDKIDLSGAPTQQLEVYGDAPTVRVTDTSDSVALGESIGKLEFYGNDGSSGGPNVRTRIDTVSEGSAGNHYGLAISTSASNAAPVERVRVASTGKVGIGTDSPGSYSGNADDLVVYGGATIATASGGASHLYFADGTSGLRTYAGFLTYNHTAEELRFGVGGVTKWRINSTGNLVPASGGGIDFGSGASTTLDDYEEGTHTATLTPASSGTITLNSSNDTIGYTKVGDLVTITGALVLASVSSPVGNYISMSLPFPIATMGDSAGSFTGAAMVFGAAGNSGDYSWLGLSGASVVRLYKTTSPSSVATAADFSGDESIYVNFTYHTS